MKYAEAERETYKLQYSVVTRKKVNRSNQIIAEMLSQCKNPYISVSWGKDSCAVLDLVLQQKADIPVVWVDRGDGGDMPDVWDTIGWWIINRNIQLIRETTPHSIFELYERFGYDAVRKQKLIAKQLKGTFLKAAEKYGFDGAFWGMRKEECRGRAKLLDCKGTMFERKDGILMCAPLADWTARDVWAYLCEHNCETLNYYDLLSENPFDREDLRTGNWAGSVRLRNGKYVQLQRYYPELYNKLARYVPDVRQYT